MGGSLDAAGSGGGGADSGTGSGGGDGTSLGLDSAGAAGGGVGWIGDGTLADDSLCGVSEVPTESGAGSIEIMIGVS